MVLLLHPAASATPSFLHTLCAVFFVHNIAADLCVLQAVEIWAFKVGMFCKTVLPLEPLSMVCLHYIVLSRFQHTCLLLVFSSFIF